MAKSLTEDTITAQMDGQTYSGRRTVTGTRTLYQTIYYGTAHKKDGHPYSQSERLAMDNIARMFLLELVHESMR